MSKFNLGDIVYIKARVTDIEDIDYEDSETAMTVETLCSARQELYYSREGTESGKQYVFKRKPKAAAYAYLDIGQWKISPPIYKTDEEFKKDFGWIEKFKRLS